LGPRILLVEDEPGLRMTVTDRLISEGYSVEGCEDGEKALERIPEGFDLIILDVMLPRMSGFDVCRTVRQKGIETPILILTARSEVTEKVVGLKLGADDYLTKPFDMLELLARIEALLRRVPPDGARPVTAFQFGNIRVDFRSAEVSRGGKPVLLSARELQLLKYLVEHRGALVSREELLHEVWGYEAMPSTRTVDVHVAWLRQKLEDTARLPKYILTVRGLGYKFAG
jgi:two-component system, OmpR family, alkaline phosphatase synthesis response regulator PhoP